MSTANFGASRSIGGKRNKKNLQLPTAAPAPPSNNASSTDDANTASGWGLGGSRAGDAGNAAQLEIGIEFNLDIRQEDLNIVKELGSGNGGTVSKVKHLPTGTMMARKVIHVEANKELRKRIVRELQIMHGCQSDYIVTFYGAFLNDHNDVIMCMEYMDLGSLDRVSRVFGPIRVDVLGKIAVATLGGLTYLYSKFHIMHRDIKPSNILINSKGHIKLCDFGVSGELVNSIADTFVGTSTYMAPERIQGEKYTVKSDVWSFGLTIMELAIGKFPFATSEQLSDGDGAPAGILDLLQQIVHEPAPKLPKSDAFPAILDQMVEKCLYKDPDSRPTPQQLFDDDPFVLAGKRTHVELAEWAVSLMERDNRKSHLAPQLSPATRELLRTGESPGQPAESPGQPVDGNPTFTPTSGEIPIVGALASPRDYYSQMPSRSPTRNGGGNLERSGGSSAHPGLGQRSATSGSIPKVSTPDLSLPASAGVGASFTGASFALPVRPAPPGGPLPPPPPRKATSDEMRNDSRRPGQYAQVPNGGNYGAMGYPRK